MRRVIGLFAAWLIVWPAQAAGIDLQAYVGKPYSTLHARLASAGYTPFRKLKPGSPAYKMSIYGRDDIYDRYHEVEACAGTGLADCEFVLSHAHDIVVVHTMGESVGSLTVADLRHVTEADAERLYQ